MPREMCDVSTNPLEDQAVGYAALSADEWCRLAADDAAAQLQLLSDNVLRGGGYPLPTFTGRNGLIDVEKIRGDNPSQVYMTKTTLSESTGDPGDG